jgi:riboflavin synthase
MSHGKYFKYPENKKEISKISIKPSTVPSFKNLSVLFKEKIEITTFDTIIIRLKSIK